MIDMNSEYYRRQHQIDDLPLNSQYGLELSEPLVQSQQQRMISFDEIPRTQADQHFVDPSSSSPLPLQTNYSFTSQMATSPHTSTLWNKPHGAMLNNYDSQINNNLYGYSATIAGGEQEGNLVRGMDYPDIPRTWAQCDPKMVLSEGSMVMDSYEPSHYFIEADKDDMRTTPALSAAEFDDQGHPYQDSSLNNSPTVERGMMLDNYPNINSPSTCQLPSSEALDDMEPMSREMSTVEVDELSADEPYAKLIHRALMSAPNHSMVLQEIYQWFRDNTIKGSADSKGWMNSIRHNLSMNAAFKKTERKTAGDETKKSTEWVLEQFAIKDGVQSTTRYRKGTGTKRFMRSENPAPARQSSGRKGGISASKAKVQRQRIRDERFETTRPIQRQEIMRSHHPHQATSKIRHRPSSPSTPPSLEHVNTPSPYYHQHVKAEPYELPPSFDHLCGLENVQGVYLEGPAFADQHDSTNFYDGLSQY